MKWNKLFAKLKKPLIIAGCTLAVAFVAGFFLNCLFTYNFKFRVDINLLVDGKTYLYAFLLSVIALTVVLAYYYKHYWLKNSKKIIQGDERDNDVAANLEQAHFQTDEEVEKNYAKVSYAELPKTNLVGIPIRAVERKGRYEIHFAKNAHTMIIGTTGSGKTTTFINPAVQILSQSAAKPSMLISDPKGELYALHAKSLADKGYTVKVLDLRNPYNSVRWNPLERPFLNYQRMLHIDEEVTADEERGGWVFEGELYNDPEELQSALQVKKQWLFDQVYEDLHDMITVLCPITNKNEPIWESGAKNFILAIAIAMLEDSANPALGMTKENIARFEHMLSAPNGIILVTGPTGSGKSTTLYAVLNRLRKPTINITTIEDPVEKQMFGINQVQVNTKAGMTFASGLRALLRQDPDVIMIGEIRDYETAEIAVRASITGHLVLSTLHTNDSVSTIVRLIDMGVPPYLVSASVNAIIAQRLVKRLCPYCKRKHVLTDAERTLLGDETAKESYEPVGCPECNHVGYSGRIAIYEIVELDHRIRKMISSGASVDEIKQAAAENGSEFLADNLRELVAKGVTSMDEYNRIIYTVS